MPPLRVSRRALRLRPRPSPRFEMELDDSVLHRKITHAYDIEVLPIIA